MNDLNMILFILPALLMITWGFVPSSFVNRHAKPVRRLVTGLAGIHLLAALALGISFAMGGAASKHLVLLAAGESGPITASLYYDGTTALMLTLVSFVGWIICRFSIRYLDGEKNQGRYYRWTAFTIGAVSMMVVSGNLLMFLGAWVMTSLGLHQLLLHYGDRPAAQRAAWTKFSISRLGDAALFAAMVLTYSQFKTLEFSELFAAIEANAASATPTNAAVIAIGWLILFGAVTKSAQVPFHTWLPQTMETPTPVSALMHAGIVNAGGYLIIRTSPLIALSPWALTTLAIVGCVTACFAATVMLTQTSIKRSLAYSTIAQMGFMMLQCGLGAFSAAMLHIVAHSLYKAHAFLGSGGVIAQRSATAGVTLEPRRQSASWVYLALAAAISTSSLGAAMFAAGIDPVTKTGGLVLGFVLTIAFTAWLWQVMRTGATGVMAITVAFVGLLSLSYAFSFLVVDKVVGSNPVIPSPALSVGIVAAIVVLGFGSLFGVHALMIRKTAPSWCNALYVHASNGFYADAAFRRVFGALASS